MRTWAVDGLSGGRRDQSFDDRGSSVRLPSDWGRTDQRIWVTGHNRSVRRRLEPLLAGAVRPDVGPIDLALIVPETSEEWTYFSGKILPRVAAGGEIGLVVTDEEAERRRAEQPAPPSYHEAAVALGLGSKGLWVASSDVLIFRYAPTVYPGQLES